MYAALSYKLLVYAVLPTASPVPKAKKKQPITLLLLSSSCVSGVEGGGVTVIYIYVYIYTRSLPRAKGGKKNSTRASGVKGGCVTVLPTALTKAIHTHTHTHTHTGLTHSLPRAKGEKETADDAVEPAGDVPRIPLIGQEPPVLELCFGVFALASSASGLIDPSASV